MAHGIGSSKQTTTRESLAVKHLTLTLTLFFLIPNFAFASCDEGVSKQIKQNGNLNESNKAKMLDDCKKFQDFRVGVDKNPKGAYILPPNSFTCGNREDYVEAYNRVLKRGGSYNINAIDRFKSCRVIRTPTLTAVRTQKDASSPIYQVIYANQYSVYYLHSQWVHGSVLVPYADLLKQQIK
ncbi:MAG: hypothetical protein ACPGR2_12880 [Psychrobium sp.]